MGKGTIDKKSSGETKGRQGSSNRNYDVLGRELFTADEVRKLNNKKCIIFIRGFDPIMDAKFVPFSHPAFDQTADGKGTPYVHVANRAENMATPYQLLTKKSLSYFEGLKKKGESVYIDTLTYEEFGILTEIDMKKRFLKLEEEEQKDKFHKEEDNELRYAQEPEQAGEQSDTAQTAGKEIPVKHRKPEGEDTLMNRMAQWQYSKEQKDELHKMIAVGIPKETILAVFYPETDVEKLREMRRTFRTVQGTGS